MTRKLHNTLMAALASTGLLLAGFLASNPIAPEFNLTSTAIAPNALVSIDVQSAPDATVIHQFEGAPLKQVRATKHRRQSLAMPFYSFAPRS